LDKKKETHEGLARKLKHKHNAQFFYSNNKYFLQELNIQMNLITLAFIPQCDYDKNAHLKWALQNWFFYARRSNASFF